MHKFFTGMDAGKATRYP